MSQSVRENHPKLAMWRHPLETHFFHYLSCLDLRHCVILRRPPGSDSQAEGSVSWAHLTVALGSVYHLASTITDTQHPNAGGDRGEQHVPQLLLLKTLSPCHTGKTECTAQPKNEVVCNQGLCRAACVLSVKGEEETSENQRNRWPQGTIWMLACLHQASFFPQRRHLDQYTAEVNFENVYTKQEKCHEGQTCTEALGKTKILNTGKQWWWRAFPDSVPHEWCGDPSTQETGSRPRWCII